MFDILSFNKLHDENFMKVINLATIYKHFIKRGVNDHFAAAGYMS